ncbi:MAG: ACT domain-containing protein [Candidatus Eremiobacteraeota bacterium]|nr:ACT domain-containing protein [Candidatus Eremiobacteraeota bacterium]
MTKTTPRICHIGTDFLDNSARVAEMAGKISRWAADGREVTLVVFPGAGDSSTSKALPELKGRLLDRRDSDLLDFCHGIRDAVIMAHMLRARGISARVLSGLSQEPFTARKAKREVLIVAGSFRMNAEGELTPLLSTPPWEINHKAAGGNAPLPGFSGNERSFAEKNRAVSGAIVVVNVVECHVELDGGEDLDEKRLVMLSELAARGISLDMINICYEELYFILLEKYLDKAECILKSQGVSFSLHKGFAKVSVTGIGMKGTPGVMAEIYRALEEGQVNVLRNTDSHITISCLIREEDLPTAIEALMARFHLTHEDIVYENKLQ